MANATNSFQIILKKIVKSSIDFFSHLKVRMLKLLGVVDYPVPPYTNRIRTGGRTVRHYYESGLKTYLPIASMANHVGLDLNETNKVLDFGCGVGRQLLHFSRNYPNIELYGCDVDSSAIDFVQKNYPTVNAYCSNFNPPLQYRDDYFDLVYSVSIFTHLSREDHDRWLSELARVTKPNGFCILTTAGSNALQILKKRRPAVWEQVSDQIFELDGFIYREYPDFSAEKANESLFSVGSKFLGIENSYGGTIISPSFIREVWPTFGFKVESILKGIIDHRQDVVVLRKA